jgi:hypothetical protein
MSMMVFVIVCAGCGLTMVAALAYLRRYRISRPAIGVITGPDLVVLSAAVGLAPVLYRLPPVWVSVAVLIPTTFGVVDLTLRGVRRRSSITLPLAGLIVGLDVFTAWWWGTDDVRFLAVNDFVVAIIAIGIANLWVQSGMRVWHVAALATVFGAYDLLATGRLTLMAEIQQRVAHVPFAPFLAWTSRGTDLSLGLGDLLIATTFVLALRRSYGRLASGVGLAVMVLGIVTSLGLVALGIVHDIIPAMAVVGPLVLAQTGFIRLSGPERSTVEYERAEPRRGSHAPDRDVP